MMEEVKEGSVLSVQGDAIKVTEVVKDGDNLTFIIISQKLSGTGEYHVARTYDDFDWLQQHLFSQEDVPGILGVIFPPLPAKAQANASAKVVKQLGLLALGDWTLYGAALERFLQQVASHSVLNKNKAVEDFLTSSEAPGRQKSKRNIFGRLSQAVEEKRKEGHKDVEDFFQNERDLNHSLTNCTKLAAEKFLDVAQTEQKIAVACEHFSAALQMCVESGEDKQAFSRVCKTLSEVFNSMGKHMSGVVENDLNTLGLGLDLESRYQDSEKEMLFRRTCKLVELEAATRNAERAKPVKKPVMEEVKKTAETEFNQISAVAKNEIKDFKRARVQLLRQALVLWCEKQLVTARNNAEQLTLHLETVRGLA
ncbi:sorting nexin-5 [Eucyclogobius newberryi]|uniref:sorting nexin-5 n=1 Tax=Eucyclogobius newberryi TaxID=166745 RepID=UPI003B5AD9F5